MEKSIQKRRCAMGERCYHVRFLGSTEPISLSPSHEGDICDRCKEAGYHPQKAQDEELAERYKRLLSAGRVLFETNVTEEDKIIPTLAFAAAISDEPDLISLQEKFAEASQGTDGWEELSERFTQIVKVMRPVDVVLGVLILQLEPVFVKPVKHPGTGAIERLELEIYSGSVKPEDAAERYKHTLTRQNVPLTDIPGRVCFEPQPGYLAVTLDPGGMLPRRPSFPPPQFVERFCEGLLGSRNKGGFAPNLRGRERGPTPKAHNVILECVAYYLGNYGEAVEKTEMRSGIVNTLNSRLLIPSGEEALPEDRGRNMWEDVRSREVFLYFLADRLEMSHPQLNRVFVEKLG